VKREEYSSFTGNLRAVAGGISLYNPAVTAGTFTVNVPVCTGGGPPTISAAYVNYYTRFRSLAAQPNTVPTFDTTLDLSINGSAVQGFGTTSNFDAIFPTGFEAGFFHRRYGIVNVTSFFQSNFVVGNNTIAVSDLQLPPEAGADKVHYGTGIIVIYGCPDFPLARVSVYAGLDWFYEGLPDAPDAGPFSEVICLTFPASAQARTLSLDGIIGGQANAAAPFRPHTLYYITGSGTPPTTTQNPPEPVLPGLPGVQQFPPNTVWTSNLGQEWDRYQNTITVPAGATYVCLQAESHGEGGLVGISGDLLSPVFTLPLEQAADTPTNTATTTSTNTATSTLTSTPTNTATTTATSTVTNTVTSTATNTPTDTATNTPTGTLTPSSTPTETSTGTITGTVTSTPTETPTGTITVTGIITETATPTVTGTITVTTGSPTATSTPSDPFVINLVKSVDPPFATRGDEVIWTITVSNPDPAFPALNIRVTDVVPEQFEILSVSSSAGSVAFAGQQVTFTIPSLGVGQSVSITIVTRVRIDAPLPFVARNNVTLTADGLPPRSAQATVVSATTLPATGETPLAQWLVLTMVGGGVVLVGLRYRHLHRGRR
jgi:hypothetical protein